MRRRIWLATALGLAVLAYLATGLMVVAPGETVVVRRLGRVLPTVWTAGPHWGWPIGFDRAERVRTDEVRRLSIGLAGLPGPLDDPGAGEYLTGDLNLLRARAVLQYRVANPVAFVTRAEDHVALLTRLGESSLTRALSRRGIDAALRTGRAAIARDVEADLRRRLQSYGLGLSILSVHLTDARPPVEVQPDFAAAQAAVSERDRRINEAKTHAVAGPDHRPFRGPRHPRPRPRPGRPQNGTCPLARRPLRRPARRGRPLPRADRPAHLPGILARPSPESPPQAAVDPG